MADSFASLSFFTSMLRSLHLLKATCTRTNSTKTTLNNFIISQTTNSGIYITKVHFSRCIWACFRASSCWWRWKWADTVLCRHARNTYQNDKVELINSRFIFYFCYLTNFEDISTWDKRCFWEKHFALFSFSLSSISCDTFILHKQNILLQKHK